MRPSTLDTLVVQLKFHGSRIIIIIAFKKSFVARSKSFLKNKLPLAKGGKTSHTICRVFLERAAT